MYTTISGSYENGRVILHELPPSEKTMKVLITFFEDEQEISHPNQTTINALQAAENGDYETVTLDSLRQQWDDL